MKFAILLSIFVVCCVVNVDLIAANVSAFSPDHQLHQAVKDGSVSLVNTLINQGANVNAVDSYKNTPLHLLEAVGDSDNQYAIADLLVNAGADVSAKNVYDKTPLDLATTNKIKDVLNKNVAKN